VQDRNPVTKSLLCAFAFAAMSMMRAVLLVALTPSLQTIAAAQPTDPIAASDFVNKVTLDVSSVAKDEESILQFTRKVFTTLQKVLADKNYKATPHFDDETVLSSLKTKKPRAVQFLDTPDCRLHKKSNFILRYRYSLQVPPSKKTDLTFKSRSDAFNTNDWTDKMSVNGGLRYETKLKEQGTAGSNQTAYAFYRQFKKAKYVDPLLRKLGMNTFNSGTIDQWAGTFPGLADLAKGSSATVSSNGLTIRQEEVDLDSVTVTLGAKQVTMEPAVVLWFDEKSPSNAFAGELTWDSTVGDSTMSALFDAIVASTLEGMVGSGSKTAAAYARMDCNVVV